METPTLNKRQQQKALSAKKTKRETIKNVLVTPYTNYWPLITQKDNILLTNILQTNLPRIKYDNVKVPWKKIKSIPKNERKAFRKQYTNSDILHQIDRQESVGLVLGVNNVSKLLEDRQASSILIAGDVQPRLMVQHITDQAVLYHTPLIIVPNLREILKSQCGVSSSTIAFSSSIKPESKLSKINETITNLSGNYPVPKNHINYDRAQDVITIADDTVVVEDDKSLMEVISDNASCDSSVIVIESANNNDNNNEKRAKYLERGTNSERVFRPKLSKDSSITFGEVTEITGSTFFPIVNETPEIEPIENNCDKRLYKSLAIKRLKGNKRRLK